MTFGELTHTFLFDTNNYGGIFNGLQELHNFYASITGVSAEQTTDEGISLPSGKAISPGNAANCLLDLQRTVVFMRGIRKAMLKLQQEFNDEPIHILYAGCGPYASLLTPLTTMFSPKQLRLHLLEVNPHSLEAVKVLYEKLQAMDYVEEFIHADAVTYKLQQPVHLIVCEAMQSALFKEPQVAITLNLIPQLPEKAIFIPEKITITAQLLDPDKEMEGFQTGNVPERINLGEICSIDRNHSDAPTPADIHIPENTGSNSELCLITEIDVFEDEKLMINNCGITLPVHVMNVLGSAGKTLRFRYEMGEKPGFRCD